MVKRRKEMIEIPSDDGDSDCEMVSISPLRPPNKRVPKDGSNKRKRGPQEATNPGTTAKKRGSIRSTKAKAKAKAKKRTSKQSEILRESIEHPSTSTVQNLGDEQTQTTVAANSTSPIDLTDSPPPSPGRQRVQRTPTALHATLQHDPMGTTRNRGFSQNINPTSEIINAIFIDLTEQPSSASSSPSPSLPSPPSPSRTPTAEEEVPQKSPSPNLVPTQDKLPAVPSQSSKACRVAKDIPSIQGKLVKNAAHKRQRDGSSECDKEFKRSAGRSKRQDTARSAPTNAKLHGRFSKPEARKVSTSNAGVTETGLRPMSLCAQGSTASDTAHLVKIKTERSNRRVEIKQERNKKRIEIKKERIKKEGTKQKVEKQADQGARLRARVQKMIRRQQARAVPDSTTVSGQRTRHSIPPAVLHTERPKMLVRCHDPGAAAVSEKKGGSRFEQSSTSRPAPKHSDNGDTLTRERYLRAHDWLRRHTPPIRLASFAKYGGGRFTIPKIPFEDL